MRKYIKRFLEEDTYEALREFCKQRKLFFENLCRAIYDGVKYAYQVNDIILYLGGEDSRYGSNTKLVEAIHNEYLRCFDAAYGTWDNIFLAIDRIATRGDCCSEDIKKEVISFLCKDNEPAE